MININDILFIKEAEKDLEEGKYFYETKERGLGQYFYDTILSDIESLYLYAGIYEKVFNCYKMLSKKFPYAIYYDIIGDKIIIIAVLSMKRNPTWIYKKLLHRKK